VVAVVEFVLDHAAEELVVFDEDESGHGFIMAEMEWKGEGGNKLS
jgi:hypothetical protein